MKKILMVCMIVVSCFLLNGCGNTTNNNGGNKEISRVDKFENMLKENSITYDKLEEENPRDGVIKSNLYYLDDDSILILYVYDTESEVYKQVKEEGTMDNLDVAGQFFVIRNGDMAITFEGECKYSALITEKFEALK